MKPHKPSIREKKRYIVYEIVAGNASAAQVAMAIRKTIREWFGEAGLAALRFREFPELSKGRTGVVRVAREHVDLAKAAFCLVTEIGGTNILLRSILSSGSLLKAKGRLA